MLFIAIQAIRRENKLLTVFPSNSYTQIAMTPLASLKFRRSSRAD